MKKTLSLILALLMIVSVAALVSCGDTNDPNTTTATPQANNDDPGDSTQTQGYNVEQKDYSEKETFTVYMRERSQTNYSSSYIMNAEEDTGDIVDNAVYNRNSRLEEFYKIRLDFMEAANPSTKIKNDMSQGELAYDIVYDQRNQIGSQSLSGACRSWTKLSVDYSNPWWDKNALEQLSIAGNCFHMSNDVSIARFSGARFFYFNNEIIENNHLNNPYDLMDKNEWVLDKFLEMVKGVKCEVEGTEEMGVYGLVLETGASNGVYMHMATGMSIEYTNLNANKQLEFAFSDKDKMEKIDDAFGKIKAVFDDKTCVITQSEAEKLDVKNEGDGAAHKYDRGRILFANGHFLFTHTSIGCSSVFTEMKSWGIAPNPKYNSDQPEYHHKVDKYTLMFCLPNEDGADLTYIGDVLDYWAYVSLDTVTPAYYELTIKAKRVNDPKAVAVVDLVKNTIRYEIADLINGVDIASILENAYQGGSISSAWKNYEKGYTRQLSTLNTKYAEIK